MRDQGLRYRPRRRWSFNRSAMVFLVRIRNKGAEDTPMTQDIRPFDLRYSPSTSEATTIHYLMGSAIRTLSLVTTTTRAECRVCVAVFGV
jgi:hypothetical protein